MAGLRVTLTAWAIQASRSNGPLAASRDSSRCTRFTFWVSSCPRSGPYSTWPSGRRGVSDIAAAWPVLGFTT